jgi:hypothetical protein
MKINLEMLLKRHSCYSIINLLLLVVVIATTSISDLASQQIVRDGSFEFPKNNMYPIKLTGSNFYEIYCTVSCSKVRVSSLLQLTTILQIYPYP